VEDTEKANGTGKGTRKRQPARSASTTPSGGGFRAAAEKLRQAGQRIEVAQMRTRGVVTIPQAIRDQLALAEGDQMIVTIEEDRIVLIPAAVIPRDQAWFWTPEWQAREAEADADLAAGRVTEFESDEEFLAALDARS